MEREWERAEMPSSSLTDFEINRMPTNSGKWDTNSTQSEMRQIVEGQMRQEDQIDDFIIQQGPDGSFQVVKSNDVRANNKSGGFAPKII